MANKRNIKGDRRRQYVTVAVIGMVALLVVVLAYGLHSQSERERPPEAISLSIAQERIYAKALSEYLCPCGACDEVFYTCTCPTAIEVKKAARRRIQAEGASYEDIAWMLENIHRAKKKGT